MAEDSSAGRFAGVAFDLDGTLLDTETLSTAGINSALEPWAKTVEWSLKRRLLGLRGPDWAAIVVRELDVPLAPAALVKHWEEYMHGHAETVQPMPGAARVLQALRTRKVPLALATSSSREAMEKKLRWHAEMREAFPEECVVCGDDPEVTEGKPAPDMYLMAAERMGVDPRRCVAFEDAMSGVQSAKAAGMFVVAVPDTRLDLTPFREVADLVLGSLEEFRVDAYFADAAAAASAASGVAVHDDGDDDDDGCVAAADGGDGKT